MGLNIGFSSNKVNQCRCETVYTPDPERKTISVDAQKERSKREAAIQAVIKGGQRRLNPRAGVGNELPNPKPDNYTIIRYEHRFYKKIKYLIVEILYHDCTNYEGRKLMVFKCSLQELLSQKYIDPHFCDDESVISPIARFEPTSRGWYMANVMLAWILPVEIKRSKK